MIACKLCFFCTTLRQKDPSLTDGTLALAEEEKETEYQCLLSQKKIGTYSALKNIPVWCQLGAKSNLKKANNA